MGETTIKLLEILLLNILLSGDNAVVISMAARNLSERNRKRAILAGGLGAVGLRIIFTFIITFLLGIPLIHLIGGILLLYISWNMLKPDDHEHATRAAGNLGAAIWTIIVADAVMSLDNVVAITATADGDMILLIIGLLLSIPIVMFGSELLSRLLNRFPVIVYVGVFILIVTAVEIAEEEHWVREHLDIQLWQSALIVVVASVIIFGLGLLSRRRANARPAQAGVADAMTGSATAPDGRQTGDGRGSVARRVGAGHSGEAG